MNEAPQQEHAWLQRLVGNWTYEAEAEMGPDQPPCKTSGTETVRPLGEFWILAEGEGTMPGGGSATMLLTLGYDVRQGRFVGTWIGSMMSWHCVYTSGRLDPGGTKLALEAEGPNFAEEGKSAIYRDELEIVDARHRALRSSMKQADGSWHGFMTAHYRRQS
jgi:hypothetical protein